LCCDPVILPFHPHERAHFRLQGPLEDWERHQYEFYLEHFAVTATPTEESPHYVVACDQFDPKTRECLAHDDRPDLCSGFPWYGRDPGSPGRTQIAQVLPPQCSYTADVYPLLPLFVL